MILGTQRDINILFGLLKIKGVIWVSFMNLYVYKV